MGTGRTERTQQTPRPVAARGDWQWLATGVKVWVEDGTPSRCMWLRQVAFTFAARAVEFQWDGNYVLVPSQLGSIDGGDWCIGHVLPISVVTATYLDRIVSDP